jgi:hypothetical protein
VDNVVIDIFPTHEATILTSEQSSAASRLKFSPPITSVPRQPDVHISFNQDREQTASCARAELIERYSHFTSIDDASLVHHVSSEPND